MANSTMSALLTTRYGDWQRPILPPNTFTMSLPFVPSDDKSGEKFSMPIMVAISQGATVDNTGNVVNLNGARSGKNLRAELDGVNLYMQEQLSYSDLMKMGNGASESGNAPAYQSGPDWVYYSMLLGLQHHSEMMALYGAGTAGTLGCDIGVIDATPVASGGPNYNSATNPVVRISSATWARLMWLNSGGGGDADKGMLVDIYQSDGVTLRTSNIRIVGVRDANKCQVEMDSTPSSSTPGAAVTAGDRIVPKGWLGSSALGVSGIMQTVGTFAGIDNSSNPHWRSQNFDCGGVAISFDLLQQFASKLKGNGFTTGVFDVWCAPPVCAVLTNATQANVRWLNNDSPDKRVSGTSAVECVTQVGRFIFHNYGYIKQGEITVIARGEYCRIGAAEQRENGLKGEGLVLELQGQSGSEMRAMAQFAPMPKKPLFSGRMFNFSVTSGAGYDIAAN
jgi:hypothetical protein